MRFLDKLLVKLSGYSSATIELRFHEDKDAWKHFLEEYKPCIEPIQNPTGKEAFDVARTEICGMKVQAFSPYYPNPLFDKEACIKQCAEQKETYRILTLHNNERDVAGMIERIKNKTEVGCK